MSKFLTGREPRLKQNQIERSASTYREVTYPAVVEKVYLDWEEVNPGKTVPPGSVDVIPMRPDKVGGIITVFPFDENFINLPTIGEVVEVFKISKKPYYRRRTFSENLSKTRRTETFTKPGDYYKPQTVYHLNLYEGDILIQSRFGQSFRFSGYNNDGNKYSPTTIIRNRESALNSEKASGTSVKEDLNRDGGTILLSSNKYVSDFKPGTVDKSNKSNFELKVWENKDEYAFENYPKKLDGDQIIISSDRLIFSSKAKETMMFSKGNLAFVTDSILTIDSNRGMSMVSKNGDIQFEANNKETKFFVGKRGKIILGVDKDEPTYALANGKVLVEAIGELIDEIIKLAKTGGILTPSGPSSGMNPVNEQALKKIMSKLPGILSKKVFIGM